MRNIGENVVRIEAEALRALADRIAGPMAAAFQRAEADLAVAEKAETGANGGVRSLVVPYRARRMP